MALLEKPIVNQGSVMMNNCKPCVSKLKMALLFLCEKQYMLYVETAFHAPFDVTY